MIINFCNDEILIRFFLLLSSLSFLIHDHRQMSGDKNDRLTSFFFLDFFLSATTIFNREKNSQRLSTNSSLTFRDLLIVNTPVVLVCESLYCTSQFFLFASSSHDRYIKITRSSIEMSAPNKSIDKNKRYAGVKANDFVNKTRTNETSRATGKIFTGKIFFVMIIVFFFF